MTRDPQELAAREGGGRAGEAVFAAWSEPVRAQDPLALFAAARGPRFYWSVPERGLELVALG